MSEHGTEKLMGQALALIKQGRLPDAEKLLAEICERNSDDSRAWFVRGAIRAEFGDTNRAVEYLSTAARLDPGNTQAHFALCKLHVAKGNPAQATLHVEKVAKQDPKHAQAWLALGSLYADLGRFQQSERASRVAVALLPGVAEPGINLANALISQGKHDEAIALCNCIKAENPSRPGILHSLGLAFKTLGKPLDAEQCFTTLVQLDLDDAAALSALGEIKAARGELSQALSLYRRARGLNPTDARTHFQIGKVLLQTSSARHAKLVARLQEDHQYHNPADARNVARELAAGFRYDDIEIEPVLVRFFDEFDPSRLYPTQWWTDALMQFGDRRQATDTALRSIFSTVFSWSLPCRHALDELAAFCEGRLASYGSGSGYWEWLLATHYGVEVLCHDSTLRHRFLPMQMAPHSKADVDRDDTIFLAWLPGDVATNAAIESLLDRVRSGQKLVLVGEPADGNGHPRTCGTQQFFRYLQDEFETVATVPLANYAYLQDCVEFLVRR